MAKIEELCFYYDQGDCRYLISAISKCKICPNFISFKQEAKKLSKEGSLPLTYFDLIVKEKGEGLQKALPISLE